MYLKMKHLPFDYFSAIADIQIFVPFLAVSLFDLFAESCSHELSADKLFVAAIQCNKLIVRTLLDDITLAHADDLVSGDNCAQSMRNHDHRLLLLLEQSAQSLLYLVLTVGIECTRSLIQEQDAGSADKRASNCDTLLLTT